MAERALFLWNNEYIVSLIAQHRHTLLPIVYPALMANIEAHWNAAVHGLTLNVRKVFQEMDEPLMEVHQRPLSHHRTMIYQHNCPGTQANSTCCTTWRVLQSVLCSAFCCLQTNACTNKSCSGTVGG